MLGEVIYGYVMGLWVVIFSFVFLALFHSFVFLGFYF